MAANDNKIPSQLTVDNFSLNNTHAASVLNKTMPILLMGKIAELLPW